MNFSYENDINNISHTIMKTMETGFHALANNQVRLEQEIEKLKEENKIQTKANYNAHTKEGKDRYLYELNKSGKTPEEIAEILDIKTVPYVKKRIREAKKNGR